MDYNQLTTEQVNPLTVDIDLCPTEEIVRFINDEDKKVAQAVEAVLNGLNTVCADALQNVFHAVARLDIGGLPFVPALLHRQFRRKGQGKVPVAFKADPFTEADDGRTVGAAVLCQLRHRQADDVSSVFQHIVRYPLFGRTKIFLAFFDS